MLRTFDFAVVNPPFSDKNWTHGLKEYGRFDGYGDRPPQKNGDFAWLLHIIKSLKRNGKAAVILPHGVLFRGNAEATIRQSLIDCGYIKGIIRLPANLFYGTGIPSADVDSLALYWKTFPKMQESLFAPLSILSAGKGCRSAFTFFAAIRTKARRLLKRKRWVLMLMKYVIRAASQLPEMQNIFGGSWHSYLRRFD